MKKTLIAVALLLLPLVAAAAEVTGARILDFGVYTNKSVDKTTLSGSETGTRNTFTKDDIKFVEKTDKIPARLGVCFGIKYVIDGKPAGSDIAIKKIILHPAIKKDNKTYTSSEVDLTRTIGAESVSGYAFGFDYLLVPGDWTIQLYCEGKKILEKTFTVYLPK